MTSRPLEEKDLPMLKAALDQDTFEHCHPNEYIMEGAYSEKYPDPMLLSASEGLSLPVDDLSYSS